MKALVVESPGETPSIAVRDVETPTAGPGNVLVKVAACGLCHHDVAVMGGILRRGIEPGIILGHEISGRVAATDGSVSSVAVGDRVASTLTTSCGRCDRCLTGREYRCLDGRGVGHALNGGFAQFVSLPEATLVPVPDAIGLEDAAILACPMGVALQGLRDVARLQAGETVLVTGAGGGLGVHSFTLASAMGARAIAVTTSRHKIEPLEALGAGDVVFADELDSSEFALALTQDEGVDVVVNPVGSAVFESCVRSLSQFGRMLLLGETEGGRASVRLSEILFRDASVISSTGAGRSHIIDVAAMVSSAAVRPIISQRFPLEDAAEAYRLMRDRKTFGRIVLIP